MSDYHARNLAAACERMRAAGMLPDVRLADQLWAFRSESERIDWELDAARHACDERLRGQAVVAEIGAMVEVQAEIAARLQNTEPAAKREVSEVDLFTDDSLD